jgi:plasmid stabilization system protein ParE
MAEVVYAPQAFADLRCIHESLYADDPTLATNSLALIRDAIAALQRSPMAGRPAEAGLRERVISRGKTGYVVLYRFLELDDTVLVLAVRHRREAGYPDPDAS